MIVIHVQHFFCTFHYQCKHDEDNDAWKGRFKNITLVCWRDFCSAFLKLSKCIMFSWMEAVVVVGEAYSSKDAQFVVMCVVATA